MQYLIPMALVLLMTAAAPTFSQKAPRTRADKKASVVEDKAPAKIDVGTVEKYFTEYDINADGTARETVEVQRRCNSNACIELFSNLKHIYNSKLQEYRVAEAYLIRADGKKVVLDPSAITDLPTAQAEASPGFSSLRELEIRYAPWRVGDAAYFRLEGRNVKPIFDRRYDALDLFSPLIEWKSIRINVSAPADYDLFIDAPGLDGGKLSDENGRSRWLFTKENLPKIDFEPVMDQFGSAPRFALTTFPKAEDLGRAFWEVVKSKSVVTPEIQALADEVTNGSTIPSEQASLIYEWVNKNIRYLSVVLDKGGLVPHDASEVVKNGYGDCKDYTVLIHTLLKAKGIESSPVLIRSELGNWFPAVPTVEYFNHAILYIPSLKLFADATIPNTRLGLIPQTIVGKRAVLAGEKPGIIDLPRDVPSDNQILSDVTYKFSLDGSVKALSSNKYFGRSEILFRPMLSGETAKSFFQIVVALYGFSGDSKIVESSDPHQLGEAFSVRLETAIKNYTSFVAEGTLAVPSRLNLIDFAEMKALAPTDSRKTNFELGSTRIRENIVIELPAAVNVTTAPESTDFTTPIGWFKVTPVLKDGRLLIARELVVTKDTITPEEYPHFKKLAEKLAESKSLEISYTADVSQIPAASKNSSKAKVEPKSKQNAIVDAFLGPLLEKPLSAKGVQNLEAKIVANEDDDETRIALLRHYSHHETKKTPAVQAAFLKHRLWLIANRPRVGDKDISRWIFLSDIPDATKESLKNAWLAAVKLDPKDSIIRFNALDFLVDSFAVDAEKLIEEGFVLNPIEYKYPLLMVKLVRQDINLKSSEAERKLVASKILQHGRSALSLIKRERSYERDLDRRDLLETLSSSAIEVGELDLASSFATELVHDFGQSIDDFDYDEVAHIANINLGKVELRRGNTDKAKEFLLIAIRAPLRKPNNHLRDPDMSLAKELLEEGAKEAVLQYLGLCLELGPIRKSPKSNQKRIKALNLWREQILKGIKPTLDFDEP